MGKKSRKKKEQQQKHDSETILKTAEDIIKGEIEGFLFLAIDQSEKETIDVYMDLFPVTITKKDNREQYNIVNEMLKKGVKNISLKDVIQYPKKETPELSFEDIMEKPCGGREQAIILSSMLSSYKLTIPVW